MWTGIGPVRRYSGLYNRWDGALSSAVKPTRVETPAISPAQARAQLAENPGRCALCPHAAHEPVSSIRGGACLGRNRPSGEGIPGGRGCVLIAPKDYDPRVDPRLLRVEARRLRSKLRSYYASSGKKDDLDHRFSEGAPTRRRSWNWRTSVSKAFPSPSRRARLRLRSCHFSNLSLRSCRGSGLL